MNLAEGFKYRKATNIISKLRRFQLPGPLNCYHDYMEVIHLLFFFRCCCFAYLFSVLVQFTNFEILCWFKKIYSSRDMAIDTLSLKRLSLLDKCLPLVHSFLRLFRLRVFFSTRPADSTISLCSLFYVE